MVISLAFSASSKLNFKSHKYRVVHSVECKKPSINIKVISILVNLKEGGEGGAGGKGNQQKP